jgi:hypothetical protein
MRSSPQYHDGMLEAIKNFKERQFAEHLAATRYFCALVALPSSPPWHKTGPAKFGAPPTMCQHLPLA